MTYKQLSKFTCNFSKIHLKGYLSKIWIVTILISIKSNGILSDEVILRVDPLALLSATLKTYQRAVCDTDQVILTCPHGTSISIEIAQYSKQDDETAVDELCPLKGEKKQIVVAALQNSLNKNHKNRTTTAYDKLIHNTNISRSNTSQLSETIIDNCIWPNAFQYSLLQTVVDACQKKKYCKFNATPDRYGLGESGVGDSTGTSSFNHKNLMVDPCPRTRRFVEIAYKCRPYEFRTKMACENEMIQLECNPYSRIAVYSSSFGRTEYESIHCPQPQGVREETCLAVYATETVMKICHGRRRCSVTADSKTLGSPCNQSSKMYLKIVYTCVPKQVLSDPFESSLESDEPDNFDINEIFEDDPYYKESEAIPKLHNNLTRNMSNANNETVYNSSLSTMNSLINDLINSNPIMTHSKDVNPNGDQEVLYVLVVLTATGLIVLCLILVSIHLKILRKRQQRHDNNYSAEASSTKNEIQLATSYNDPISIDSGATNIDLATMELPSVTKNENFITYNTTAKYYQNIFPSNSSMLDGSTSKYCFQLSMDKKQSPDVIGINSTYVDNDESTANDQNQAKLDKENYNRLSTLKFINNIRHNDQQIVDCPPPPPPPTTFTTTPIVQFIPTNNSCGLLLNNTKSSSLLYETRPQNEFTPSSTSLGGFQSNAIIVIPTSNSELLSTVGVNIERYQQ